LKAPRVGGDRLGDASAETSVRMGGRRAADEARARMSSEEYLAEHDLRGVLVDALRHVHRTCAGDLDAETAPVRHIEAAAEYFHAVATARHVVGREFQDVRATARGRAAFHLAAHRVLRAMALEEESSAALTKTASAKDWHEILTLLCPDFPFAVTAHAVCAASTEEELASPEDMTKYAHASAATLAPNLRVAVEYSFFLETILKRVFEGEPDKLRVNARTCLGAILETVSKGTEAPCPTEGVVREAMAAAATRRGAADPATASVTHRDFAVALCRRSIPRAQTERAMRACELAARRAEKASAVVSDG